MYQCSKFSELKEIAQWIPLLMPRKTTNNDDDDSSIIVGGYDLYNTHLCDICVNLIIYPANSLESYMCQCWQLTRQYKWTPPYHIWGILLVNNLSVFWTLVSLTPSESGLEEKGHFNQTWPKSSVRILYFWEKTIMKRIQHITIGKLEKQFSKVP